MRRTKFDAVFDKRANVDACEKSGMVADSMEVRAELLARVESGEITGPEAQEELKKIKRNAKRNGQITRAQAFSRG